MRPLLILAALLYCHTLLAIEQSNTPYVTGNLGTRLTSNEDSKKYGDGSSLGLKNTQPEEDNYSQEADIAIGFQFSVPLSIEAGVESGPIRRADYRYDIGGGEFLNAQTIWHSYGWWIMPAYRKVKGRGIFASPCSHTLGVRVGSSVLNGRTESWFDKNSKNSLEFSGTSALYGVAYRYNQSLGRHFGIGFEVGYTSVLYTDMRVKNGTGPHTASNGKIETNPDGSALTIDNSGPFLKLNVSWLLAGTYSPEY